MKKVIMGLSLVGILSIQWSCSQNEDQKSIQSLNPSYQLTLPEEVPSDLLSESSETLFDPVSNLKLSLEELSAITESVSQDIPDFENMSAHDIELIQKVFVGISESDIENEKDQIQSVFNKIQQYKIAQSTRMNKTISARALSYPAGLCRDEFWLLFLNPQYIIGTQKASTEAANLTIEKFGSSDYNGSGDAFRHALWNALIAKYCGSVTNSVDKAVNWAEKFTNTHEECGSSALLESKMDLHNNDFGQRYFYKVAWVEEKQVWFWKVTRVYAPETVDLVNYFYQEALNNSLIVGSEAEINATTNLVRLK
ncbi:MAG: DUF6973 domain-containing protein [Flavobacteriales bacterium]